jgi:hypothetical protein
MYALVVCWVLIALMDSRSMSGQIYRVFLRLAVTVAVVSAILWITGIAFWHRSTGTPRTLLIPLGFFLVGVLVVLADRYARRSPPDRLFSFHRNRSGLS